MLEQCLTVLTNLQDHDAAKLDNYEKLQDSMHGYFDRFVTIPIESRGVADQNIASLNLSNPAPEIVPQRKQVTNN
jgi:hypothetical protein